MNNIKIKYPINSHLNSLLYKIPKINKLLIKNSKLESYPIPKSITN